MNEKERIYPYLRLLPEAERELWPPAPRDDVIERRVKEVEGFLNKVPVLTFKLSNIPVRVRVHIEYEKENAEQPGLLFDYVLGKHKVIPISVKDLIPLPDIVGVRILFTAPRKYEEIAGESFELAGLVEFNNRHVYFVKPDFITDKVPGQKSPRRIPFRFGFMRLSLLVEHADGSTDKLKLGEAEVFWIRHSEMCSGMSYIVEKRTGNKNKAEEVYRKCVSLYNGKVRARDNWALLLIHRRYRDAKTGRWREEWLFKLYNFINTNAYKMPGRVKFGNQVFEIVDFRKYRMIIEEDLGVYYEWELEPYAHSFTAWFAKTRAKRKGGDWVTRITVKPFRVYKLRSVFDNEEWYLLVPEKELTRIVVENKHHWRESWGRIFVELRRGNRRVDGLLVRHKKLYPQVIVFDR